MVNDTGTEIHLFEKMVDFGLGIEFPSQDQEDAMRLIAIAALLIGATTQGCSVVISGMGREPTDFSSVGVGAARQDIEIVLGIPKTSCDFDSNRNAMRAATYSYDLGFSGNPRMVSHYPLEVLLLEPVMTVVAAVSREMDISEQTRYVTILYDSDERAERIDRLVQLPEYCGDILRAQDDEW